MARATTLTSTRHLPTPGTPAADLRAEPFDLPPIDLYDQLRGGFVRVEAASPRRREYPGETPIEGQGAVARWLALHARARQLRAALPPGDDVGEHQARRAIRSLFLYEHQLTAKARRQARTALWRRDRAEPLPNFAERSRWARCRCQGSQPQIHATPISIPHTLAEALLRSA